MAGLQCTATHRTPEPGLAVGQSRSSRLLPARQEHEDRGDQRHPGTSDRTGTASVLAHEQAHLKGRHHLPLTWIRLLDTAFPGVPLLRAAATDVPELVEWAADDRAAREAGPH